MTENNNIVFYQCPHCPYKTKRSFDLKRHHNAIHKFQILNDAHTQNTVLFENTNVPARASNVASGERNVAPNENNVTCPESIVPVNTKDNIQGIAISDMICKKCGKIYKTKKCLINHEKNCNLIGSLTCPRCMKTFSSRQHKNRHIKANKCKPRSIIHAEGVNKEYIVNDYGNERTDYLDFDKYLKIFKSSYDIPSTITKEVHFNDDFPENHNIKYNNNTTALIRKNNKYIYKDLHSLVEEIIKDKTKLIQVFAHTYKDTLCKLVSMNTYEEIIEFMLKIALIKEPADHYKCQVSKIIDMIRNTV